MRHLFLFLSLILVSSALLSNVLAQTVTRGAPSDSTGPGYSASSPTSLDRSVVTIKDAQGNIISQHPATAADNQMVGKAMGQSMDKAVGAAYKQQTGKELPPGTGYRIDYDSSKP